MDQSANTPHKPARRGGEFFLQPTSPTQRRYEALRAYLADGVPAATAAQRFGYTLAGFSSLVRDFRAGRLELFPTTRPGPRRAPAKDAARARVLELRLTGHSIDEISAALAAEAPRSIALVSGRSSPPRAPPAVAPTPPRARRRAPRAAAPRQGG
jgi:hypothetical protein